MRVTGSEIRLLRMLKNIDQKTLAKMVGKSQQYISKLERYGEKELPAYWCAKLIAVLNCKEIEIEKIKEMLPPLSAYNKV